MTVDGHNSVISDVKCDWSRYVTEMDDLAQIDKTCLAGNRQSCKHNDELWWQWIIVQEMVNWPNAKQMVIDPPNCFIVKWYEHMMAVEFIDDICVLMQTKWGYIRGN